MSQESWRSRNTATVSPPGICVSGSVAANQTVRVEGSSNGTEVEEQSEAEEEEAAVVVPSAREALAAVRVIQSFFLHQSFPESIRRPTR